MSSWDDLQARTGIKYFRGCLAEASKDKFAYSIFNCSWFVSRIKCRGTCQVFAYFHERHYSWYMYSKRTDGK